MPVQSFHQIKLRSETKQKTVTELCLDKNTNTSFVQSDIVMIDFDALAKEVGKTVYSSDGLALNGNTIHFVEFKNQKWGKIDISNYLRKIYDGISIFGFYSRNTAQLQQIDIHCTIICNPDKNPISVERTREENPVFDAFQKNLEESENEITSNQDVSNYQKSKDGKLMQIQKLLEGLSKFGIQIKVNALLTQKEINEFLLQFENQETT